MRYDSFNFCQEHKEIVPQGFDPPGQGNLGALDEGDGRVAMAIVVFHLETSETSTI